jgi:uncharacterized protein (DUF2164 family)
VEARQIQDARNALIDVTQDLDSLRRRTSEEHKALVEKFKQTADSLFSLEDPFLGAAREAVKREAQDSQDRLDAYQQGLEDARSMVGTKAASYWREVKGDFLIEIEAVAGKELKNRLNKAFDANFAGQLKAWKDEAAKTRLDPVKLQKIATNLVETIYTYSKRVYFALNNLDRHEVQQIQDKLNCGLAAIQESVTKELKFLFDHAAFDRSA